MDIKILRLLFFISLSVFLLPNISAQDKESTRLIKGRIIDSSTKETIPYAGIYMPDVEKGTIADAEGVFSISVMYKGDLKLRITSLGYVTKEITVKKDKQEQLEILLSPQSIELEEFTASAKYHENQGSDAEIGPEALEYIQPTSIRDIFLLLPGGTIGENNIQSRSLISSRQAGSDQSTSFGMGVSTDGIPMQNDGIRIQLGGYTGRSSVDPNGNVSVNTGVDLRTISTDHIESVTVTKGIASAKEGNLSSGSIKVFSKKGKTPLRFRAKLDPLNKLAYLGKGFFLSEKLGTLHTGIDITKSASDLRDTKAAYNRITAQTNYNNLFYLFGKKIDFNLRGSFISSFSDTKKDQQVETNNENYKTRYQRYTMSSKIVASLDYSIIDELEILFSGDYSKDVLSHSNKKVMPTIMGISSSTEEGESEGVYLPSIYYTNYRIENKPLNIFSSIGGTKQGLITDNLNYTVLAGTSLSYVKNHGLGAIVDPQRPPFTSGNYIRPRPNSEIPALVNNASYIETKFRYKKNNNEVNTSLGLRGTQMLNLPKDYDLNSLLLLEPRVQLSYTLRNKLKKEHYMSNTLRFGFGVENKLPSIDYLYPDKIYQDFVALNAYYTDADKRLLLMYTKVHDPINEKIRENKNKKTEIGWDLKYDKYSFSLSFFQEAMKGGVEYFSEYSPISYTRYDSLKHEVVGKPSGSDYYTHLEKDFTLSSSPVNSSKVIKKGLEYRINIPKIDILKSDIEINGAYYNTLYTSGVPVMFRPSITEDNKPYPYVGIYEGYEKTYSERFNTNIWINTHLPKLKLIFTNFIQFIWLDTNQLGQDVDMYPSKYMDLDGNVINTTPGEIENSSQLLSMKRVFNSARYNKSKKPVSMLMNLKLTKEFNRSIKLSFFANNILQISPAYKSIYLKTQRDWHAPFFGTELIINL